MAERYRRKLNGKFRGEWLSIGCSCSRCEAAVVIEAYRQRQVNSPPSQQPQYLTSTEFKQQLCQDVQPAIF